MVCLGETREIVFFEDTYQQGLDGEVWELKCKKFEAESPHIQT